MPLRRYASAYPKSSLFIFWVLVPALILFIAVVTQVQNQRQADRTTRLAQANTLQVFRLKQTTRVLCNRGYIIDGLVQAALFLVIQQRQIEKRSRPAVAAAETEFIHQFNLYHSQLLDELTSLDSPCAR